MLQFLCCERRHIMRVLKAVLLWFVAALLAWSLAFAQRSFKIKEDFDVELLTECMLQYYYYVPCPTYAWFWSYYYWDVGDVAGEWFDIGDMSMGGFEACDPSDCMTLSQLRILNMGIICQDPWGYGTYPGAYVHFDVYCGDDVGRPVGPSLWRSDTILLEDFGWNYIPVDPPLSICGCATVPGPPASQPRVLVTITVDPGAPGWCMELGGDNISDTVTDGCQMHDYGCLPALYPRPLVSHYTTMHSAFYRQLGVTYDPPKLIRDRNDTTPDHTQYGYVELAWRIYLSCTGPSTASPSSWSGLKALFR
jgi:hypothetical protein